MGNTRFNKFIQFEAQAVTGTNTYISPETNVNQQHNIGIHARFTGTMAGTLSIEGSNPTANEIRNNTIPFVALTDYDGTFPQPAGADSAALINIHNFPFEYIRVSYVNASGSGTMTSVLTSKDLS